jgi:AraC-like DNA-binding protein
VRPGRRPSALPVWFERDLAALLRAAGIRPPGGRRAAAWSPYRFRCAAGTAGDAAPEALPGPLGTGAVKDFVEAHAGEALDLERLAREVHLSKYHFARTFREAEGVTPWAYVQRVRVRKAKALLDAGVPLSEAALRAGFCDQSHFTHTFRRHEGVTPGQYRKKRKDLQDRPPEGA